MGVVYRARDLNLDRDVALKVLPTGSVRPQARKQFRKEALALAKLKHANIGMIHDFGTENGIDFLVMELIDGENLAARLKKGPLTDKEAIEIGVQVARALEEAHEQHIVHLDLKPHNVMLTPKGQAKVLDFGVARLVRPIDEASTASMTEVQRVAGTLPYMAPEQFKDGIDVDMRTDVYALGATLYEMVTGERPFPQADAQKLIAAILHSTPTAPRAIRKSISPSLERIMLKALEKEPARRYQTIKDLAEDLERCAAGMPVAAPRRRPRWISRQALIVAVSLTMAVGSYALWLIWQSRNTDPPRTRVAVVPFDNLTGDPDQDYLAEGMTVQLISRLAQLGGLQVIGRETTMRAKDTAKLPSSFARTVHAGTFVQATVLQEGNRIQVTAELTDAVTNQVLWSDTFNRDMSGILSLLNEVTLSIARGIEVALSSVEEERLAERRLIDPRAYRAYTKAEHLRFQSTEKSIRQAMDFFSEAITIEPKFAEAHAGLANCWLTLGDQIMAMEPSEVVLPKAKAEALRALQLDPSLAAAHTLLGSIVFELDKDWLAAEDAYKRALELNPSYAAGRLQYGQFLRDLGRYEEALVQIKQAQELDVLNSWIDANVVGTYAEMGLWNDALKAGRHALETNDHAWATHWILGVTHFWMGEYEEAVVKLEHAMGISNNSAVLGWLARAYVYIGERDEAIRIVDGLESLVPPPFLWIACVRADLGEIDVAVDWLERAYDDAPLIMLPAKATAPSSLRSHPRFNELFEQLGIPSTRGDLLFARR